MEQNKQTNLSTKPDTVLEISWNAITHNLNYFKKTVKESTKLMLMVKASAYGYGAIEISKRIEQHNFADYLGVAITDEGIELREAGIKLPIMVQNPSQSEWAVLVENCLEPIIHNFEGLNSFKLFLEQKGIEYPVHIKVNTGMNRLGFDDSQIERLIEQLKTSQSFQVRSLLTHLSSSGNYEERDHTLEQLNSFDKISNQIQANLNENIIVHALNTDGINSFTSYQMNMIRLGVGIYGASENETLKQALIPAAKFKSKVVAVRKVLEGETIGYNRKGQVETDKNIAILALGYADGFPRKLGNGNWEVEINGKLYPTIGAICMDLCMIDTGNDQVQIGDNAILFGGKKSIFEYAIALDTITYEAVTSIGKRVKRLIV